MISKKIIDVIKWKILTIFYYIKVHKWNLHTGFYADYLFWLLLLVITLRPDNNLMEMNKSRTKFVLFITKQQCLKRMILWFWLLDQCKSVDMWIVEKSGQKTRLDLAWSCLYWILDKCHLGSGPALRRCWSPLHTYTNIQPSQRPDFTQDVLQLQSRLVSVLKLGFSTHTLLFYCLFVMEVRPAEKGFP